MRDACDVTVILDRSGSMSSIRAAMEEGFNGFIEDQKKDPRPCYVSLVQFDSCNSYRLLDDSSDWYMKLYTERHISDVPKLTIRPRGGTALLDAVGKTIVETGERLRAKPEHERPNKVLLLVITDGAENSSREYNRAKVKEMIEHQRAKYNWETVFLGSSKDEFEKAEDTGYTTNSSLNFAPTYEGTRALWSSLNVATSGLRCAKNYLAGNYFENQQS